MQRIDSRQAAPLQATTAKQSRRTWQSREGASTGDETLAYVWIGFESNVPVDRFEIASTVR
jgi:hypothetical protein